MGLATDLMRSIGWKIKTDTISVSQLKHYAYDEGESEDFISKKCRISLNKKR